MSWFVFVYRCRSLFVVTLFFRFFFYRTNETIPIRKKNQNIYRCLGSFLVLGVVPCSSWHCFFRFFFYRTNGTTTTRKTNQNIYIWLGSLLLVSVVHCSSCRRSSGGEIDPPLVLIKKKKNATLYSPFARKMFFTKRDFGFLWSRLGERAKTSQKMPRCRN